MIIIITSTKVVSINNKAGLSPNIYGTIKAAMASNVALTAVFIAEAFAIAAPA